MPFNRNQALNKQFIRCSSQLQQTASTLESLHLLQHSRMRAHG